MGKVVECDNGAQSSTVREEEKEEEDPSQTLPFFASASPKAHLIEKNETSSMQPPLPTLSIYRGGSGGRKPKTLSHL